jgi:hypothetical protein
MRRRGWIIAASAIAVLWAGTEVASRVGGEPAERRVRRYFAVRGALDTVSLRAAVLREIPVGTPESRLAWFADSTRLGRRGDAIYTPPVGGREAWIRFDQDPAPLELVFETYMVGIEFDGEHRIRDVHVHRAFTGP